MHLRFEHTHSQTSCLRESARKTRHNVDDKGCEEAKERYKYNMVTEKRQGRAGPIEQQTASPLTLDSTKRKVAFLRGRMDLAAEANRRLLS